MKLHEEFEIDQPVEAIWSFFDQPQLVARCIPGVEEVTEIDAEHLSVRATERIGPMSATFDTAVTVLERKPKELVRFQAVGRSVRGAAGNLRSTNTVRLLPAGDTTSVVVEAEIVLAGALGSVGQKIVAKQAARVTEEFARNLERSLRGEDLAHEDRRARGDGQLGAAPGLERAAPASSRARLVYLALAASGVSLVTSAAALAVARRARR